MANPALKNGYLSIANELAEHFATVNITGQEWRIIWFLWRKTWGWKVGKRHKESDWISITQFEKATGMKKANVYTSLKSLLVKRIIAKQENKLKFNQNYNEWLLVKRITPLVKRITPLVKSITPISQKHNKTGSQKHNNKRNKETLTKERHIIPPPIDLVKSHIAINNYNVDADIWFNFYTSKGWKIGKTKMVDWQATIRTWAKKNGDKPTKATHQEEMEAFAQKVLAECNYNHDIAMFRFHATGSKYTVEDLLKVKHIIHI